MNRYCRDQIYKILTDTKYNPVTFENKIFRWLRNNTTLDCKSAIALLRQRLVEQNYPIEYLLGQAEFYGYTFYIKPPVYIPNPFTERLLDKALAWLLAKLTAPSNLRLTFIDIGTGSSALISALYLTLQILGNDYDYFHEFITTLVAQTDIPHTTHTQQTLKKISTDPIAIETLRRNINTMLDISRFYATDISAKAIEVALMNIKNFTIPIKLLLADVVYIPPQTNTIPNAGVHKSPTHSNNTTPIHPALEVKTPEVIILTNKPYLPKNAMLPKSVLYQAPIALYKNQRFDLLLSRFITHLRKQGTTVHLFMETLRTRSPLSAKISQIHYLPYS